MLKRAKKILDASKGKGGFRVSKMILLVIQYHLEYSS